MVFLLLLLGLTQETEMVIGSKKFTESVILGDLAVHAASLGQVRARHRQELGGTRILWEALRLGEIHVYPEYTGTLRNEIFADRNIESEEELRKALAAEGIGMTGELGFNNTYALGMREKKAAALGITKISQLSRHPDLRYGFTSEFLDRADGWPGLQARYSLPRGKVTGLDHDLAYRGLLQGSLDVTDFYSTDAEIRQYDLRVLEDDLGYFPEYRAVFLFRTSLEKSHPDFLANLRGLEGKIDEAAMTAQNFAVKVKGVTESRAAALLLGKARFEKIQVKRESSLSRVWKHTKEHLLLVFFSLLPAILVSIPLGIYASRDRFLGQMIVGAAGIIQTIPALALLVLLIAPFQSIGFLPAVAALFMYSLLPIIRNTATGIQNIAPDLRESAQALGLSGGFILRRVELPLALPTVLAGIKTAAVMNIGFATLGALIGAGGYGQPILTGIRLNNFNTILEGAVPAAALALLVQLLFELAEKRLVSRGLRLK